MTAQDEKALAQLLKELAAHRINRVPTVTINQAEIALLLRVFDADLEFLVPGEEESRVVSIG